MDTIEKRDTNHNHDHGKVKRSLLTSSALSRLVMVLVLLAIMWFVAFNLLEW
ncbi:hypothetical protein KUM_0739 [Taylorella asinigenitalis 14/45]|uniref:Uncharacterized protein n=2 Tax=Taylorella asinigenitalis TaxID=84590 RepID=G4QDE2_TAYAM|nr:hypothetical protein [Taylorella asinigenitalis]AEP35959.1 hypothetical protein TASI_0168 [Taylorella asinigenitalis MCE3]CCG19531.1 hypothetical protein KUM_0739 [Taylorella asinigenitalis 14/45]